jgi:hypothetical protein
MHLERKLDILNSIVGEKSFPANRVYREGDVLLATTGWQLLAFQLPEGEQCDGLWPLDEGLKEYQEYAKSDRGEKSVALIRQWLNGAGDGQAVKSSALLDFLRAKDFLRCPYCKGCGQRPASEPDMEEFEFEDEFNAVRLIQIDGQVFDGTMLVSTLAYLPTGETLALSTHPNPVSGHPDGVLLRIVGDGWTLVQMNMAKRESDAPDAFPLDVAEAATALA